MKTKKRLRSENIPYFGKSKLYQYRFDNGLRLLVSPNKIAPVFSYQTWFNVGSRDEEQGKSGLAHLFEHMMFKGTKKNPHGVFDRTMESSGARDLNAFTSTDYTAYVASLPAEHLSLVARLESDRMVGLSLTDDQFTSEREVVRNERKQRTENNPEGMMFEELQQLAFQKHPYGRPVIGYEADLDAMSTADCIDFYQAYYAPNNAVICVVGGVTPDRVADVIHKAYGDIPASQLRKASVPAEPEQKAEKKKSLKLPLQVEKAYFAYKIPSAQHADQVPLSVLTTVLTAGRSSRLYRALVDKGMTLDVAMSPAGSKDSGLLYLTYTCQPGKSAEEAAKVIEGQFADVIAKGISEEELERAKNKLRTETHLGLSTNSAQAHFLGQNQIVLGSVAAAVEEIERMETVTAGDLQEVAKKYLNSQSRTVIMGVPQ